MMETTSKIPFSIIIIALIAIVGTGTYFWIKRGTTSQDSQKNNRKIQISRT